MERKWWTLLAVCLGTFMLLVDVTIVNVALPSIQRDLHASFSQLQWVVDAYALSLAALLLTSGSLADLFGRRLLFACGLAVFTVGSLLCALAADPLFLVLSRAGQGIGGAIMFATSLALLADAFRGRDRGTALAIWGAVTGVAVAAGPVLGGVITSDWSWRGIFYVNLPIGVLAMAVTLCAGGRVPRPAPARRGLARVRVFHRRAHRAGLRPDPGRRAGLGRSRRAGLPGGRRGAAGRVPGSWSASAGRPCST